MEEDSKKNIVNHYEAGSNCQVFNGDITGCVFAMPGATVTQQVADCRYNDITLRGNVTRGGQRRDNVARGGQGGELFHFVHPSLDDEQAWLVHEEMMRLVSRQGIQEICAYLKQLVDEKRILLPQSPSVAYAELVRMGMPCGNGFSDKTFQKHYRR